jgi:hypothetical protein
VSAVTGKTQKHNLKSILARKKKKKKKKRRGMERTASYIFIGVVFVARFCHLEVHFKMIYSAE